MKKKILVSRLYPKAGIRLLEKEDFHLTLWKKERPMTQVELIEQARTHHALLCTLTDRIDRHFLDDCSHLEIISQFAVGYDNIDIASATRLGIPVGFTPDAMSEATADITFGLMIAVARKIVSVLKWPSAVKMLIIWISFIITGPGIKRRKNFWVQHMSTLTIFWRKVMCCRFIAH